MTSDLVRLRDELAAIEPFTSDVGDASSRMYSLAAGRDIERREIIERIDIMLAASPAPDAEAHPDSLWADLDQRLQLLGSSWGSYAYDQAEWAQGYHAPEVIAEGHEHYQASIAERRRNVMDVVNALIVCAAAELRQRGVPEIVVTDAMVRNALRSYIGVPLMPDEEVSDQVEFQRMRAALEAALRQREE